MTKPIFIAKTILDENSNISDINFNHIYFYIDYNLSEAFIERYKDKLFFPWISQFQKLSNKFIVKHIDKLDFYFLKYNKNVDQKFIEKLQLLR